jgi:hypothetical protein
LAKAFSTFLAFCDAFIKFSCGGELFFVMKMSMSDGKVCSIDLFACLSGFEANEELFKVIKAGTSFVSCELM